MNKIYKVIWSKTRNCYVAVSEIAKRNGKGSFVHKGKAALALAVSLWMAGGVLLVPGLASAANSGGIKVGDTYRGDNGTLENNEIVYDTNVDGVVHVVGAYATDANQTATNNTVTIDGNVNLGAGHVAGAWLRADNSRADGNTVIINSGTINDVYGGRALGGGTSTASGNTVTINGGTIKQMVAGGYFSNGGTAKGNTITLNGVTIGNGVYGGYANNGTLTCSDNILNLSGTNTVGGAVKNFETINFENVTWGTPALKLTGTYTGDGISQNADGTYAAINTQSIVFSGDVPDAGTTTLISGTNALPAALKVYTGATTKATLTTSGVVVGSYKVTDGSDDKFYKNLSTVALANENKAVVYTVTDNHLSYTDKTGTAGAVTLYAQPSASDTDAGYTVAVNNYTLYLADGFKSLTVAGGDWDTLTELYAGYTTTGANLSGYSLSVTGTLNAPNVYSAVPSGAYGEKTTAATTISGNAVNIDHGTIDATGEYASIQLYGSWIRSKNSEAENGGSASDNSVNIDNGTLTATKGITISGEKSAVAMAAVTDGSVKISDSVITSTNGDLTISGIENSNAGAARGSVTISGSRSNANSVPTTRLSARQIYIYAANAYTYESKQGSVSLSGDVGFKGNVSLYGKHNWATDGTGNTLHIGTDDVVWRGYTSTDGSTWTQTNAIGYVYNFDTIALHAVEFPADPDNALPALKTTDLSYRSSGGSNDLSKVTLDLTNLSFVDGDGNAYTPTSGSMKLLDTATDLTGMKLAYDAATQATPVGLTEEGVVVKKDASPTESEANGVTLAYRNTHTVAFAADSKSITYNIANLVGDVTLGTIDWVKDGTARTLTDAENALFTFNGTTAVNAENLTFTGTINENPLNQSMTLLAGATGVTGDHITPPGEGKGEIAVAYTDAKNVKFDAKASGTVSVDSGAVKYAINSVALDKATLGSLAWGDTDSLPDSWKASGTTQIDDTNFAYTGAAGTALKAGNTATILTAPGLLATSPVTDGTVAGKTVDINYTDDAGVTYTATASGHVAAAKDAVNYVVDSVAATGVNLQSWNGTDTSAAVTTNGWNGTGVAVTTGSFAAPTDLNLGETRTIATAPTGFFGTVTGSNAFPCNGGTLSEDTGGVKLTGSMIGGVKAEDDGTTATLTYYAMQKTADTMTLGTFAFADGDANARTYGKEYDLTNAEITTDGLAFTEDSKKTMETGNKMTLVDASGAYKNGGAALKALSSGAKTSFAVTFSDTIEGKGITFAGTHTDTLTQDTAKTKLTYTVGDKNVKTATLNGTVNWSDGASYYTNGSDVNQNNVAANYKFDGNTSVDISNVSFSATSDPLAGATKTMTLLKGVNGVAAGKVSGTPAFAVTLDQSNTKLDAKATGSATVSGNDVTYTVSGVAIDKVNVKSVGSTADTVPENWTLAAGASVETDNMTAPSGINPGETRTIITATGTDYFNGIAINGSHAWKLDGSALDATPENGVAVAGTQTQGGVKVDETNKNQLIYEETKKKLTSITLGEVTFANGGTARTFDNTYDATEAAINADGLKFTEASSAAMETGNTMTILDATAAFKDASGAALVAFADKSYTIAFSETNTEKNVTVAGTHTDTLSQDAAKTKLTYTVGTKDVKTVDIGQVDFVKGSTLFDRSGAGYNYAGVAALGTSGFAVAYASPETVASGDSMTLLQANATLADMAAQAKETAYSYAPVSGVTIDATVTGNLEAKGGAVTYTAAANQANKLTFTSVSWQDSGALMTRPANITFAGAAVDTTKIGFTGVTSLEADQKMTLVSDFGSTVGTITGTKYMIGTTNEGEGSASLEKGNLVFKTKTGAGGAAEQTHRTVMATEAGVATLATGQDFVDSAVEGLGLPTNISPDGTATYAATGGGKSRYKTGSHVDTRTWNAVVAVGSKREHKKGDLEWGVFAEYGRGSYTLHNDDGGKGDGDTHYAGGGLLAKWTNKHNVYTEASVRMGRISDSANNMLQDAAGNQYGYNVHANYFGAHLGVGKIYKLKGHRDLDVYGKFFYTRRNGVSFNAAGRYDLDAVSSSLLRVGARYGTNDKKWNWYGGLAFEYQFDGEAKGMLNGITPIRSASIKGASVRGEIGIRMDATKTNPWKADISIYGYGGRHRGIGGNISVAYMF